jgi:uncharacterized protein YlxP (DUF503 family)
MFVAVLTLEGWIHEANSLKEKRMVVNSLLDRIRARFDVSAAQLDEHDQWQAFTLGVVAISNREKPLHTLMNHVRDLAETEHRCDVTLCRLEIL